MDDKTPLKHSRRDFLASSALAGAVLAPGGAALNVPRQPAGIKKLVACRWMRMSKEHASFARRRVKMFVS